MLVLFLAFMGLGIYGAATNVSGLFVGVIIFGIIGAIVSIMGIVGSFYDRDRRPNLACCLILFYILCVIVTVIFVVIAYGALVLRPAVDAILLSPASSIEKTMETFDLNENNATELTKQLNSVKSAMTGAGVIGFIAVAAGVVAIIAASIHMGKENFQKFYGVIGSLLLVMLGVVVIIVAATAIRGGKIANESKVKTIAIIVIVFATLLILMALAEFFIVCCARDTRGFILVVYTICILILTAALIIITIVIFVFLATVSVKEDDLCKEIKDQEYNCGTYLTSLRTFKCAKDDEKCSAGITMDDVVGIINKVLKAALAIVILPMLVIIAILVVIDIGAFLQCKRNPEEEHISTTMPGYKKQTDRAF